ncbi:MAG: hypothetical protein RLZZ517_433 [Candidatus Parcubacteria bacterium]
MTASRYAKLRFASKSGNLARVRVGGIEPPSYPWQGYILPLNYTRNSFILNQRPLNIKKAFRVLNSLRLKLLTFLDFDLVYALYLSTELGITLWICV